MGGAASCPCPCQCNLEPLGRMWGRTWALLPHLWDLLWVPEGVSWPEEMKSPKPVLQLLMRWRTL